MKINFNLLLSFVALLLICSCESSSFNSGGQAQKKVPSTQYPQKPQNSNQQPNNQTIQSPQQPQGCSSEQVRESVIEVMFTERNGCEWGENGNLPKRDYYFQARYEHEETLELPTFSQVCQLTIESKETDFLYDDVFFLTIEDKIIIASDADLVNFFDKEDIHYLWNFEKIKGQFMPAKIIEGDPYCLGGLVKSCEVPAHNQRGPVKISMDAQQFLELTDQLTPGSSLPMKLIVTGDNNPDPNPPPPPLPFIPVDPNPESIDCKNSQLTLEFKFVYLQ